MSEIEELKCNLQQFKDAKLKIKSYGHYKVAAKDYKAIMDITINLHERLIEALEKIEKKPKVIYKTKVKYKAR